MKLNRRQLRRLIESTILEQSGAKPLVPKDVRQELERLRLSGFTALAFDGDSNEGIVIVFGDVGTGESSSEHIKAADLALKRLRLVYGEDRVARGAAERLQGGSAAIKGFGNEVRSGDGRMTGEGAKAFLESFIEKQSETDVNNRSTIFIKKGMSQA
jgi:hypothetical protein